ncbi:MAG: hypothetical protein ACJAZO_004750, partial [Myxococcota bacterium]
LLRHRAEPPLSAEAAHESLLTLSEDPQVLERHTVGMPVFAWAFFCVVHDDIGFPHTLTGSTQGRGGPPLRSGHPPDPRLGTGGLSQGSNR